MNLQSIIDTLKKEISVFKGEATKDTTYIQENTYTDIAKAERDFEESKKKLFHINGWSKLPGTSSEFELYTNNGNKSMAAKPQIGDYICILLPGPMPENWVIVADIVEKETFAEFTVFVSSDPRNASERKIEHFFSKGANSTFRVEIKNNTLVGSVIGKNEGINNEGKEAGDRSLVNTVIAETGWAFFQKLQWDKLAAYFVHKIDEDSVVL